MLRSLFLFKSKVLKTKKEDLKSDKSILLEDIYIANSLQKCRAKKAFKRFFKKKLKIGLVEFLVFSETNKKKGKVVIIAKVDRKEIVKKLQLK